MNKVLDENQPLRYWIGFITIYLFCYAAAHLWPSLANLIW